MPSRHSDRGAVPLDRDWRRRLATGAAGYRRWLIDRGSLTDRVRAHCAALRVELVYQGPRRAARDERMVAGGRGQHAFVREVFLTCAGTRVVFAHSVTRLAELPTITSVGMNVLAPVAFDNETTVEILFTSGTTAQPKGVMLTHANCLWSGERASKHVRLQPGERVLTALPCFHVNAQSISILSTLTACATVVLLELYSASKFWEQVRRHRANMLSLVPALMRTIAAQPPQPTDADHAVRVSFYAINCTDKEKADFESRFGVRLLNGYGLTEAMTVVTIAPIDGNRRWPSIGLPTFDRQIRIVDDDDREVLRRQVGELIVRGVPGRTIMKGYYKNPEATAATVRDGWLHTGDNAWMDEAGYIYFFDRKKDVIKRGAENVSASEVEGVLMEHPAVLECAVIGVPDPIKDEAVKAFVVAKPGTAFTVDEILAHCAGRLARFKVPQLIEVRDGLPKTSIGKIEKKILRREGQGGAA